MIKEVLERRIGWASNPAEDARWCEEWGYRAYVLRPVGGTQGCLLLARGSEVVGVAQVGDTLVFDGAGLVIRVAGD